MRNVVLILIIAFLAAVSIVAFIAQHEVAWLVMGLCYMLGSIGWAAAQRERRAEHDQIGQAVWNDVTSFVASVERKSEERHADQD